MSPQNPILGSNNQSLIDPNIENISSNINRTDQERILAATQKIAETFYSSDESNDSLVIDQDS